MPAGEPAAPSDAIRQLCNAPQRPLAAARCDGCRFSTRRGGAAEKDHAAPDGTAVAITAATPLPIACRLRRRHVAEPFPCFRAVRRRRRRPRRAEHRIDRRAEASLRRAHVCSARAAEAAVARDACGAAVERAAPDTQRRTVVPLRAAARRSLNIPFRGPPTSEGGGHPSMVREPVAGTVSRPPSFFGTTAASRAGPALAQESLRRSFPPLRPRPPAAGPRSSLRRAARRPPRSGCASP